MTGVAIGIDASGGAPAYPAAAWRQAASLAGMYAGRNLGARPGVRPGGTQLQVSLAGSTITVQAGVALVDPALTTAQGPYWTCLNAAENPQGGPLQAAHATLPRRDIVVLRVYDHTEDSSGLRLARSEYIAGTANASPSEPAVPAGSFRLATIDVPQFGGGSAAVTNNFPFMSAPGGILPVRAAGDISAAVAGRYRHRLDTGVLEQDTGSVWRRADWFSAWGRIQGRRYDAGPTSLLAIIAAGAGEAHVNMQAPAASLIAGRHYNIHATVRVKATGTAGDINVRLTDGVGYIGFKSVPLPNTVGTYEHDVFGVYTCVSNETRTFGVNMVAAAATGVNVYAGASTGPVMVEVSDVGPTGLVVVP